MTHNTMSLGTIHKLEKLKEMELSLLYQKVSLHISRFFAFPADVGSLKITESDELALRSAELAEKLDLMMNAFGDFTHALNIGGFDESVSSSDLEMLIVSLYSLPVLQLCEFLMQADILRLKFESHHLDVQDFVHDFIRIACVDRRPEFLKQLNCTVDLAENSHGSSCCDDCGCNANHTAQIDEGSM